MSSSNPDIHHYSLINQLQIPSTHVITCTLHHLLTYIQYQVVTIFHCSCLFALVDMCLFPLRSWISFWLSCSQALALPTWAGRLVRTTGLTSSPRRSGSLSFDYIVGLNHHFYNISKRDKIWRGPQAHFHFCWHYVGLNTFTFLILPLHWL